MFWRVEHQFSIHPFGLSGHLYTWARIRPQKSRLTNALYAVLTSRTRRTRFEAGDPAEHHNLESAGRKGVSIGFRFIVLTAKSASTVINQAGALRAESGRCILPTRVGRLHGNSSL